MHVLSGNNSLIQLNYRSSLTEILIVSLINSQVLLISNPTSAAASAATAREFKTEILFIL
jgi:hypothetical protein